MSSLKRETWFWMDNSERGEPSVRFIPEAFTYGNAQIHVQVVHRDVDNGLDRLTVMLDAYFPIPSEDYMMADVVDSCGDGEKASSVAYSLFFRHVLMKHYRKGTRCEIERFAPKWWNFYMDYLRREDERRVKEVMED